jgi:hypothetical protein
MVLPYFGGKLDYFGNRAVSEIQAPGYDFGSKEQLSGLDELFRWAIRERERERRAATAPQSTPARTDVLGSAPVVQPRPVTTQYVKDYNEGRILSSPGTAYGQGFAGDPSSIAIRGDAGPVQQFLNPAIEYAKAAQGLDSPGYATAANQAQAIEQAGEETPEDRWRRLYPGLFFP